MLKFLYSRLFSVFAQSNFPLYHNLPTEKNGIAVDHYIYKHPKTCTYTHTRTHTHTHTHTHTWFRSPQLTRLSANKVAVSSVM